MRRGYHSLLLCLLLLPLLCAAGCSRRAELGSESAEIGGRLRSWLVHLPPHYGPSKTWPLVIAYHGRGGGGAQMAQLTGLDEVADQQGFIVVYPEGVERSWAAHVGAEADKEGVDSVGFTAALLDRLEQEYPVDRTRVVLAGFSDGADMVQLLGCKLADRVTAIVPVSGTLPNQDVAACRLARPLSVVEFHGTADPIATYVSGRNEIHGPAGLMQSVDQTIAGWAERDGCQAKPVEVPLPNPADTLPVVERDFPGCAGGVIVRLYRIEGGGHAWPGEAERLTERITGRGSAGIDASAIIGQLVKN